jgi:hypothetical protein
MGTPATLGARDGRAYHVVPEPGTNCSPSTTDGARFSQSR